MDEEEDSEHVWQGFSSYFDINVWQGFSSYIDINVWQGQANPELLESEEEEQSFELVNGAEEANLISIIELSHYPKEGELDKLIFGIKLFKLSQGGRAG